MSRSIKRTPICGHTLAESEKKDKRLANRCLRRTARQKIRPLRQGEAAVVIDSAVENPVLLPNLRDVSNVYTFDKDGKQWLDNPDPKDLRK